jgi:hypothetical protein
MDIESNLGTWEPMVDIAIEKITVKRKVMLYEGVGMAFGDLIGCALNNPNSKGEQLGPSEIGELELPDV